jgi:hypothetical protein
MMMNKQVAVRKKEKSGVRIALPAAPTTTCHVTKLGLGSDMLCSATSMASDGKADRTGITPDPLLDLLVAVPLLLPMFKSSR